jgi:hypothetical protein
MPFAVQLGGGDGVGTCACGVGGAGWLMGMVGWMIGGPTSWMDEPRVSLG